jgi:hypothetical protein
MTDKQINRAIAEACGWTQISDDGMVGNAPGKTCNRVMFVPLYCSNLNAMHQAESTLSEDQLWRMAREIERNPDRWYFRATARERAEAFLRTLGKWANTEDSSAVGEGSRSC